MNRFRSQSCPEFLEWRTLDKKKDAELIESFYKGFDLDVWEWMTGTTFFREQSKEFVPQSIGRNHLDKDFLPSSFSVDDSEDPYDLVPTTEGEVNEKTPYSPTQDPEEQEEEDMLFYFDPEDIFIAPTPCSSPITRPQRPNQTAQAFFQQERR